MNHQEFMGLYGRYANQDRFHYHRLIRLHLETAGLRVLYVEKIDDHPVWTTRAAGDPIALLEKLPEAPRCHSEKWACLERRIRFHMKAALCRWEPRARLRDISCARDGKYYQIGFLWPRGQAGRYWFLKKKGRDGFARNIGLLLGGQRN